MCFHTMLTCIEFSTKVNVSHCNTVYILCGKEFESILSFCIEDTGQREFFSPFQQLISVHVLNIFHMLHELDSNPKTTERD